MNSRAASGALLLCLVWAPSFMHAQEPLIDRDLFFGDITIGGAKISPDGHYVCFVKPYRGTRNIWVKRVEEPFDNARPVTAENSRPIQGYFWSQDSKYIVYRQDAGGDENFGIYAVNPTMTSDRETGVPPSRAITRMNSVRTEFFAAPKAKPDILYLGLNDRDPQWHDLYEVHISTGQRKLIRKNTDRISGWDFDHAGTLRLVERATATGDTEILRPSPMGFSVIYTCTVFESCEVADFDATNKRAYLITNKGNVDLAELELMDPDSGKTSKVESDPAGRVDLASMTLSQVDHRMLFTEYEDNGIRRYLKDPQFARDYQWLADHVRGQEITFGTSSADENLWVVGTYGGNEPGSTYIWDRRSKTLTLQYRFRDALPRESLSETKAVHYASSDGLDIPAYLTLPRGLEPKDLPLIVWPHGGPWERDSLGYDTMAQFLANRGYAVLQPNFRGSRGYGKKFLNAGNGEWGRKMQDDLTWGVKALVAAGTVDPKRVGIGGGSYGGYATLAGVAFTPQVYAAAVAYAAPSNLITFLDAVPAYWEAGRRRAYMRIADPTTVEGKALLVAESPLTQAKAIVTPLLVVQGKNDPRVNVRESEQIVAAVRDNGKPVEYLLAPDEGHGFNRPVNVLSFVAATERFYAQYLGGQYQKDVPSDIAANLKAITVDPTTVSGTVTSSH